MPRSRSLIPRPAKGQVRVRVGALGMSALGVQAAGLVEAVGPEAGGFAPGDRVSYRVTADNGGLHPLLGERDLIGFPKDVSLEKAAALLPLGLVARAVIRLQRPIGRGNRVFVAPDPSGADAFVRAWASDLGAELVEESSAADVVVTASDYEAARRWRYGHGLGQQAAVDVFQAVRRGVFDELDVTSYPISDADKAKTDVASGAGPVLLLPAA
jgi:NADPH:quinone reductase-like Zn-dependent oxidoreductase